MKHIFDVELAQEVGINAAIILENLLFWCKKNEANDKHFYEGSTWTYNSIKAFGELFPYLSKSSISNALNTLETIGYIITGNFNKISYDRTKWYSVTEKGLSKIEKCISQKQEMDFTKTGNGLSQNRKPIPDINPDIKPSLKDSLSLPEKTSSVSNQDILTAWNKMASSAGLNTIIKITPHRQKHISSRLKDFRTLREWRRLFNKVAASPFLCGNNDRDWQADFDWLIKNEDNPEKVMEGKYNGHDNAKKKSRTRLGGAKVILGKYDDVKTWEADVETGKQYLKGSPEHKEWLKTRNPEDYR